MKIILLLVIIALVLAAMSWWCWFAPRIRCARVTALTLEGRLRSKLRYALSLLPAQQEIRSQIDEVSRANRTANALWTQARKMPLPVPAEIAENRSPSSQLEQLAGLFDHPSIALAVAGGEQLGANLFEMALPETLPHLAEHALHGLAQGVHHALATGEGLAALGKGIFSSVSEHGALQFQGIVSAVAMHLAKDAGQTAAHNVLQHVPEELDPSAAQGFHFPYVTLILSTTREVALLADGKTTFETALGHVAIDTATTAGGGFAGAKAGAFVGSLFGPVGTGIGGLLGAVGGAIAGRFVGTSIKRVPLDEAIANYRLMVERCNTEIENSARRVITETREHALIEQSEYHKSIGAEPLILKVKLGRVRSVTAKLREKSLQSYKALLKELPEAVAALRSSLPSSGILKWMLGISIRSAAETRLRAVEVKLQAELEARRKKLPSHKMILEKPLIALRVIATLPLLRGSENDGEAELATEAVHEIVTAQWYKLGVWAGGVAGHFRRAIISIHDVLDVESRRHAEEVQRRKNEIATSMDEVRRQQVALGM